MTISGFLRNIAWALVLSAVALNVEGAPTAIATAPLATSPSTSVLPNIMYILDDSGSMGWNFLPDWACNLTDGNDPNCQSTGSDPANYPGSSTGYGPSYLFNNNGFNGVYYNPTIVYTPPTYYTPTGAIDTTTYPSMTGTSAATGGSNWTAVPVDGYHKQSTSTSSLQGNAFYWTIIPGEYCDSPNLVKCTTSSTPTGVYTYPATLRWCNSNALTACKATFGDPSKTYAYFRAPAPPTATITLGCSSCTTTSFSHITISGKEILSAQSPSTASSNTTTVASSIAANINACTYGLSGNCQTVGYSASASGGTVTITAPTNVAGNSAYTPVITTTTPVPTKPMTATAAAFAAAPFYSGSTVPGSNLLTVIQPGNNSYVYPGTTAKAPSRTDCTTNTDNTCSYAEEMTNFANWFAYYQTRMQMMKTAASNAFATIGSSYQVGYMSISTMNSTPNTAGDFVNPAAFDAVHKLAWYTNFFQAKPGNSTPLRVALATIGRLYAGKLTGSTLNGVKVSDPMQFSCQQNFSILSTDGYWNETNSPTQLNGSTAIGQQDGFDTSGNNGRPYIDGASVTYQKSTFQNLQTQSQVLISTSQVQQRTQQVQASTAPLQKQTSQLQQTTSQLQAQTSQLQKTTSQLQTQTSQLQKTPSQLQSQTTQLQKTTSQLQSQTTQLQKTTSQLQSQTAQLQKTTSQLLSQTSQLQKTTSQLQKQTTQLQATTERFRKCSTLGSGSSGWGTCADLTFDCTSGTGDSSKPYCRATAPATTAGVATCSVGSTTNPATLACNSVVTSAYANASSCTATTTPDSSGNTTQCQYVVTSTTGVSTCSTVTASSGPTYTVQNPVACNTVVIAPYANASSCTATTTPNSSGNTTQCQYVVTSTTGVSTCSTVTASSGPAYTVQKPVACNTVVTAPYANASACTATTTPNSSGNTTQCQYVVTSTTGVSTCSTVTASSGPAYTVQNPVACNPVVTAPFANTSSTCTATTTPNSSGNTTQCQYVISSTTGVSTCSAVTASSGPTYSVINPVACNPVVTAPFANTSSACTATTTPNSSGNTTQCQYVTSSTTGVSTCSIVTASSGPTYSVINPVACSTVVTAAYANASSCTATTTPNGSGNTTQCQYVPTSTTGVSSCTPVAASSGPAYTVTNPVACNTAVTVPYANASSCTATTTPDGSGNTKQCQYVAASTTGASSCTPVAASSGPAYTVTNPVACNTVVTTAYANASSCNATTVPDGSGNTIQCQYGAWSAWANASSCTPAQSSDPSYTIATATQCQTTDTGSVVATGGVCTPSGPTVGKTVTCPAPVTTGPTPVASCTPALASSSNNYTVTTCSTNPPTVVQTPVASCTPVAPTAGNSYLGTSCSTNNTGPTTVSSCTSQAASSSNNWTATTCTGATSSGGVSNTLADVAEYYYMTDLRTTALGNCTGSTGNTLCSSASPDPYNNVPTSGLDSASWQHMTTFTLGLGATGYMHFSPTYRTDTSGDFYSVYQGTLADPSKGTCTWQSTGTACNWPAPVTTGTNQGNDQTTIDDLWHAAVNGRGTYFSATNPLSLTGGLATALAGVSARIGASAAATTSNPNITSGDNFVFSSTFTTSAWTGDLVRQQLDLTTGIASSTIDWSAATQLALLPAANRTIYTFSPGSGNNVKPFTWAGLASDLSADQSYFNTPNISGSPPTGMTGLSQFCTSGSICLSAAQQTDAQGQNLVNFLRGDNTNEVAYYRTRASKLGDIVNAEAVYVKTPLFTYGDAGYLGTGGFVANMTPRAGRVYAAANDGMLHAFDSTTGVEQWAYIPHLVLPNLYKLADVNYSSQHTYYLDGTPVAGDICPTAPATPCAGNTWKTILVGGLNRGGRGYYALDVTDPTTPKALWEFTDTNMGFTFGNPEIAKLANGTWVVLVTSGYNNIASTSWPGAGDGVGRLYVLNAYTGALINTISTNQGSATTPSGLARIRAYADDAMVDNTALRAYGGDLLGNLWRFDINNTIGAAGTEAQKLVTLYTGISGTVPQPITARPEVGDCSGNKMVFVGTGEFLGQPDIDTVPPQQSFYGIKDSMGTTTGGTSFYGNPQATSSGFIQQTLTNTTCPAGASSSVCLTGQSVRTSSNNAVSLGTNSGWYLNLPDAGERDNTDPTLGLATLAFNSNVPSNSSCTIGGYSYRYFLNYCTGAPVNAVGTSGVVSAKLGNALATRPVFVRLPSNAIVELTRTSDGTTVTSDVPIGTGIAPTRRVSWRELTNDQ